MAVEIGDQIGVYTISGYLGAGGMASVYQGYHAKLDRHVAIKVMHQAMQQDTAFQSRFEREARIVARLEHPNIVPIYDYNEHDGQPYLVMKFVEGETLKDRLRDGIPAHEQTLQWMTKIANALTYAHNKGVLHRDIKPSNIIIDDDGKPHLTDFGLARIAQAGESTMSADVMLGTPQYISPEQARGNTDLDSRTDVYSLGIVLYEMLTGRVPYKGDTPYSIVHDHIYTPLPPPRSIQPDIPETVERVLFKALAKNPVDRYNTPDEMVDDFRRALEGNSISAAPKPPAKQPTPPTSLSALGDLSEMSGLAALGARIDAMLENNDNEMAKIGRKVRDEFIAEVLTRPQYEQGKQMLKEAYNNGELSEKEYEEGKSQLKAAYKEHKRRVKAQEEAALSPEEPLRRRVEERVKKRREEFFGFLTHLFFYTIFGILFFDLDGWVRGIIQEGDLSPNGGQWVALFWGIGVVFNFFEYFNKFGPGARRREAVIQREYEREWQRLYGESSSSIHKQKNDQFVDDQPFYDDAASRRVRLTDDGEFTDSYLDDLRNDDDQQRRNR